MTLDLASELAADQQTGGHKCATCDWIAEQPQDEQVEWDDVMAAPLAKFTNASVTRAMRKRGFRFTDGAVRNHRLGGHRQ